MKRLFNLSLYKKIIILLTALSLIPLLIVSIRAYSFFNDLLFEMITDSNMEVLNQTANNTEEMYEDINDILDKVALHPSIQNILKDIPVNDGHSYNNARFFSEYANLLKVGYPEIAKISIHSPAGKRYDSIGRYLDPYADEYTPYEEIKKELSKGNLTISSIYTGDNQSPMVSFGKEIFDLSTGESIGIAVIDIELNRLAESFAETKLLRSGYITLLNQEKKIIYHPMIESGQQAAGRLSEIEAGEGPVFYKTEDKEFLLLSTEAPLTGWKIIGVVPYTEIHEKLIPIRNQFLLIISIIIISVVVFAVIIHGLLVRPIKKLQKSMNRVRHGDFSTRVNFKRTDEIGNLGSRFNAMVSQMEILINRVYQTELKESRALLLQKQAEIKALQEKIAPHFLYNTLNTISWFAYRRGVREIQLVVDSLSNMLRYSLRSDGELVELQEEIKYLKLYIDIIEFRYENEFTFVNRMDQHINNALVPRLFLQPLIENALKHGFTQGQTKKEITVDIKEVQEGIVVLVKDNGEGIPDKRMKEINQRLHPAKYESIEKMDKDAGMGIGLNNVHQRIQLTYGEQYGIELQSRQAEGTLVKVTFPYKKAGEEIDEANYCDRQHQHGYSKPG